MQTLPSSEKSSSEYHIRISRILVSAFIIFGASLANLPVGAVAADDTLGNASPTSLDSTQPKVEVTQPSDSTPSSIVADTETPTPPEIDFHSGEDAEKETAPKNLEENTVPDINSTAASENPLETENTLNTPTDSATPANDKEVSDLPANTGTDSNINEDEPIIPVTGYPRSGTAFRSAAEPLKPVFTCERETVYTLQSNGRFRNLFVTEKEVNNKKVTYPAETRLTINNALAGSVVPINKSNEFPAKNIKRNVDAFAINGDGTTAYAIENGAYNPPECNDKNFKRNHPHICNPINPKKWFRIYSWNYTDNWTQISVGNNSFIAFEDLPDYQAYRESAPGGRREITDMAVGAWNPLTKRYYFGFFGARRLAQRNVELYLYSISPENPQITGPVIIDVTSHYPQNNLPMFNKHLEGDIAFDVIGNLFVNISGERHYKLAKVPGNELNNASAGSRISGNRIAILKSENGSSAPGAITGIAFRGDGALMEYAEDHHVRQLEPQNWSLLNIGESTASKYDHSDNADKDIRSDLASCASPTYISVEKEVESWADPNQKENFQFSIAYYNKYNEPLATVTTTPPGGDGLGKQNGGFKEFSPQVVKFSKVESRVVISESLADGSNPRSKYDVEWNCQTGKGMKIGPIAYDRLNLHLEHPLLHNSHIKCTVKNTKKDTTLNPQAFRCNANAVYVLEDTASNRIVEILPEDNKDTPRVYPSIHHNDFSRHNAFAINKDGSEAYAIEMNIFNPGIQHIWIKKFDGKDWDVMPVDNSTAGIKIGLGSFKALQAGAINPKDGKFYFGFWKPRDWAYKPYPVIEKYAIFELFYYDHEVPGGAIFHVASIQTDYSPEKVTYGRFLTLADEVEVGPDGTKRFREREAINGDITFDHEGNLFILGSVKDYGQVVSVRSYQIDKARNTAERYYHRNNNDSVGPESEYSDFYKYEPEGCHEPNGQKTACYSIRKDPSTHNRLIAHTVGTSNINNGGDSATLARANGITFRNDGILMISSSRYAAGFTVNPWERVLTFPERNNSFGDYGLPTPPSDDKIYGDMASCNSPTTLLIRKNLPNGRYVETDQFQLSVLEENQPETARLSSKTRGTETGLQLEEAHVDDETYTAAEWVGPVPLVTGRRYNVSETLVTAAATNDPAAGASELARKYHTKWECGLDVPADGFGGTPIPGGSGTGSNFGFQLNLSDPRIAGKQITCTITNIPKPVITWEKVNKDGELLSGSVWTLTEELAETGNPAGTQPHGANGVSEISDCAVGSGNVCPAAVGNQLVDSDPLPGKFRIESVHYGTYKLVEKTAPKGYDKLAEDAIPAVVVTPPNAGENSADPVLAAFTFQTDPKVKGKVVNEKANSVIEWSKVAAGTQTRLSGSEWELTSDSVDGFKTLKITDCIKENQCAGTNDANPVAGEFKVEKLKAGTYVLAETVAPAGYMLKTDSSGRTQKWRVQLNSPRLLLGSIENEQRPLVSIPLTGGMSADAFLIAGSAALGVSAMAAIYMIRRRRVS